jgi:hypothetical protein
MSARTDCGAFCFYWIIALIKSGEWAAALLVFRFKRDACAAGMIVLSNTQPE